MLLKNTFSNSCVLFITFFSFLFFGLAQTDATQESFIADYQSYFKSERKTVHLHLNKSTFITGEHIWFSSYVFNQTKNSPSTEEEYVYVDLLDQSGQVLDAKTLLFKNGSGKGDFLLDESLETGNYYLQAYTSNMQNFEEDESTVYPIQIKNIASGNFGIPEFKTNRDSLQIAIAAEGGNLVEGLFNTLAVRTTNAFGYGLQPDSLYLADENHAKLAAISIDKNGLGIFSLLPQKNIKYELIAYINGGIIKKSLPLQQPFGHTLSVDRNHTKKQFVITLNAKSQPNQNLRLILHKDGNAIDLPLAQNTLKKQALILSYDAMNPGMNTISLLNSKGQVLAERFLFHRPLFNTSKIELKKPISFKDSISVAFHKSEILENAMVSASILPGNSRASTYSKKAFYSIHLEKYLDWQDWQDLTVINCQKIEDLYYLDKVTLLANAKYKWSSILSEKLLVPIQQNLTATLEGYINAFKENNDSLQVLLYSKENKLLSSTSVDNEKKFSFKNIVLAKGSKINLTLTSKKGKPIYANFFYTIKPSIANFRYRYQPRQFHLTNTSINTPDDEQSSFKKIEQLNEVTVTANKLKYQKFFKSYYGVKVDSTIGMTTLMDFLSQQGYYSMFISTSYPDPRRAGSVQTGKFSKRCGGYIFPTIMINGKFDAYIDLYTNIRMEFLDEIYFDRPTSCSATVVVFTNEKYNNRPLSENEKKSKEFIVDNGYDVPKAFERPAYFNTTEDSFTKFGILSWSPSLLSNPENTITLVAPLNNQNSVKVVLEGMTTTGDLISEDFIFSIKE